MANRCVVTHAALIPTGVLADAWQWGLGKDDSPGFFQKKFRISDICLHAFDIQVIGVLVHSQVHRSGNAHQVHVDLHLGKVLRLGLAHLLGHQIAKALVGVRLELQHVPGFGCFKQIDGKTVKRAPKVAAMGLHPKLTPGLRINFEYGRAGAPQVEHQTCFLQLTGFKQAQQPSWVLAARHPPKVVPKRTLAFLANEGRAKVAAKPVTGIRFITREDRLAGEARDSGQFSHGFPLGWRADRAHAGPGLPTPGHCSFHAPLQSRCL